MVENVESVFKKYDGEVTVRVKCFVWILIHHTNGK